MGLKDILLLELASGIIQEGIKNQGEAGFGGKCL